MRANAPGRVPRTAVNTEGNDANRALIEAFGTHLATRSRHTRDAYVRDAAHLLAVAGDQSFASMQRAQLARCLGTLHGRGVSGRSLARMLSAWRAFFRFLLERGALREDPSAGLKAPKAAKRLPSALTPDEAVQLLSVKDGAPAAVCDRALFELAYSSGLRVSELAAVDIDRVDLAGGEVRVWGKGAKERVVPVGAAARAAITAWLKLRASLPPVDAAALFVGASGRRMSTRTIERRLATLALRQGLNQHVHPHMLRHSFASHVLQSSGDLRAVQEMLGHASIASTQVYTHLDFQALAKVYDAAHPRAKRKK